MSVESRLAASWSAMQRAGMTRAATWTAAQMGATPVAAVVLLDAPGARVIDDVVATEPLVTYRAADWPSVRSGDRITIGTAVYEAREVVPIDDGLIHRATVRRIN